MAHRNIHYEASFESYLRAKGWPYVAVDETKKAVFADGAIKSFDFLVYSATGPNLLVDVKGRKFPDTSRSRRGGRTWENWITRDDADGLREWERVFGEGFRAVLVFAYWLQGPARSAPFDDIHVFRGRNYAYVAVPLGAYVGASRPRSVRWGTLTVPSAVFAQQVRDVAEYL